MSCNFRVCVYRSRTEEQVFIIEAQKFEGDGMLFGTLYRGLKNAILTLDGVADESAVDSAVPSTAATKREDMPFETVPVPPPSQEEADKEIYVAPPAAQEELELFATNVYEMIVCSDPAVVLNGLKFACEMATGAIMRKIMIDWGYVSAIARHVKGEDSRDPFESRWICQHALVALGYLVKSEEGKGAVMHDERLLRELEKYAADAAVPYHMAHYQRQSHAILQTIFNTAKDDAFLPTVVPPMVQEFDDDVDDDDVDDVEQVSLTVYQDPRHQPMFKGQELDK